MSVLHNNTVEKYQGMIKKIVMATSALTIDFYSIGKFVKNGGIVTWLSHDLIGIFGLSNNEEWKW